MFVSMVCAVADFASQPLRTCQNLTLYGIEQQFSIARLGVIVSILKCIKSARSYARRLLLISNKKLQLQAILTSWSKDLIEFKCMELIYFRVVWYKRDQSTR
jgi:hypothetical protein